MPFPPEQVPLFLAVLDTGSFSAAARQLGRVPSAVSMAVGQLEAELVDNAWLSCPADSRILFDIPAEERLSAAAASLGINLSLLTAQAGHA